MAARLRAASPQRLLFLAVVASAYAVAFLQRPGKAVADTRIELSADPGLFLERVASLWSATTDFGHLQSGQFTGYLVPMAPFFAAGDAMGLPVWIVQRLWLGTLIATSAWGAVKLMRALLDRRDVVAGAGAALVFALNPYVVQFASRGTVTLIAYATLPWLMLAVHRGVRYPRGWRAPAAFGLLLAVSGGGVNAAVIAFALLGPVALVAYELALGVVTRQAVMGFAWKAVLAGALCSAWWIVPVLLQAGYGSDFLLYTEQPRTIWGTTSMSELLRLLGFWGLYTGVGFGGSEPFLGVAGTYLFNPLVIVASFAVPALAIGSVALARRWRYAPFFAGLIVLALLVMFAGFPDGTLLRRGLIEVYNQVQAVQFLRTTYKAAPLLAIALACLCGAGAAALARRGTRFALPALALVALLAALPLVTGRALDEKQAYGEIPSNWKRELAAAQRDAGSSRTMVLPGELFGYYRWGDAVNPVGPALSESPVAIREIVPYAGPRSSHLQVAVDDLVQQDRLVPGQFPALLQLLDVSDVLVARDSRLVRSGALDPARAEEAVRRAGLAQAAPDDGPRRAHRPPRGFSGPEQRLPDLSLRRVPGAVRPGGVRVHPEGPAAIVEGDAEGIPALAAVGLLDPARPLFLAGDAEGAQLPRTLQAGAEIVLTDSARRRTFVAPRLRSNRGPTLGPDDPISPDSPRFEPFPARGSEGKTVARLSGVRRLYSPAQPGFSQFPQYRPFAAMDGHLDTSWLADENVPAREWYLQVEPDRPLRLRSFTLVPHANRYGRTARIGVSVNGGPERIIDVRRGRNEIRLGDSPVRSLKLRIAEIVGDEDRRGAGGIAELEIPGLRPDEWLRLPTVLSDKLKGRELSSNPLAITLQRTTADFPGRAGLDSGEPEDRSSIGMVDAESGLEREVDVPAARRFSVSGWAEVRAAAPDPAVDRLIGIPGNWSFSSSSRFEGVAGRRASSAFDGNPRTAWVGNRAPGGRAWLEWSAPRTLTVQRLRLRAAAPAFATPSRVRVSVSGASRSAAVSATGEITLDRSLRGRRFRIEVTRVRRSAEAARRSLNAVAIAEVSAPGLRPPAIRRAGSFASRCGELKLRTQRRAATAAVSGSVADMNAGRPLLLRGCGAARGIALGAGANRLSLPAGTVMAPDHLALRSRAPDPVARTTRAPGRVTSVEDEGPSAPQSARLSLTGSSWVVLTQSYNRGWRATCRLAGGGERDLGAPVAIDGYANGWRAGRTCREVSFAFAPQRVANAGFGLSALAGLVFLVLALWRRGPRPTAAADASAERAGAETDAPLRVGPKLAIPVALSAAVAGALLFALRMGPVIGVLTLVLLLVGVTVRRLVALALAAIALVVMLYLVFPAEDKGGFSFQFATDHMVAHWVTVVAVCLLAGAAALAGHSMGTRRGDSLTTTTAKR